MSVRAAFDLELTTLPLACLLPTKEVTDRVKQSAKYQSIAASINEVGLVEPIVVYRKADSRNRHLLLDGHLKRMILMERGDTEVECILADDDEAFTYNNRINRIGTVQEHFLILRAIERGISEEKLAKALGVRIEAVKRRQSLLKGISDEAAGLLMDKPVNPVVFDLLRKMKPARQAEAARLMVSTATYSSAYARALLVATAEADLAKPRRRRPPPIVTSADLALMERELKKAQQDFRTVELAYGADMVNLAIATRYISTLLGRPRIVDYLDANHPEMLSEFRSIVAAVSVEGQPTQQADAAAKEARNGTSRTRKFVPSRGRKWQRPPRSPKKLASR
ncbi:plasmid partitioning protein RepB C-terminal domain-containing protein [Bradyrhizobium elkanii]|uniref:plasmid partitioning protein RepB C-terminal domain-containing protein n=1 Tax=Bradyrhizobium elkanii TaxID=29448 RepID=UPI001AE4C787|nr:plasmid partitioning protein RepB C-terminal domain-containing protein [Bradyrhizobium elkanii]WLA94837.1 plasmid partitioning protein RepB C-terminal domain-containing protein [Bradyrhizobium elkanii]